MSENKNKSDADNGAKLESFWPKKFIATKLRPPAALLKEQASLLGQATQNIITAGVSSETNAGEGEIKHNFRIFAPGLGNYRVLLFSLVHKVIEIYPLKISSELLASNNEFYKEWEIKDESALTNALKEIFADPKTTKVVESLLAQSEGYDPNDIPF